MCDMPPCNYIYIIFRCSLDASHLFTDQIQHASLCDWEPSVLNRAFCQCVKSVQIRSFFWSLFSCIRTEYGYLWSKSPYSVRMQENTDQKHLRIWTLFTQCAFRKDVDYNQKCGKSLPVKNLGFQSVLKVLQVYSSIIFIFFCYSFFIF